MNKIDYATLAKSRYTNQFEKDEVFDAIVQTLIEYKMKTQELCINFAKTLLDIELSTGKNLDLIGSIVGQPRILVDFSIDKYFGFLGNPRAEPYDKGLWYSTFSSKGSDSRVLSDEEYRRIIKARIIRNNTNCSRADFIKILDLILGIDRNHKYVNILDNSDFRFGYRVANGSVKVYNDFATSPYNFIKVTSSSAGPYFLNNKVATLKLEAGKKYTISFKASTFSNGKLRAFTESQGEALQDLFEIPVSNDRQNPTKVNFTFTSTYTFDDGIIDFGGSGNSSGNVDWFEISELQIREGEQPPVDSWEPSEFDSPKYTLTSKAHGNIDLDVYNYTGDLGIHFLSNYEKTGDLVPKPLGYKLSVMIH